MASVTRSVSKGDPLILFNKKLGFVRAFAAEDFEIQGGGSALFRVWINSEGLPGISEAVISVNYWDVYRFDDPELAKDLADAFVRLENTR